MGLGPGFSTEIIWSAFEPVDDRPEPEPLAPLPEPAFLRDDLNYLEWDDVLTLCTPCANKEWAPLPIGMLLTPEGEQPAVYCIVCGCPESKPDTRFCKECGRMFSYFEPEDWPWF